MDEMRGRNCPIQDVDISEEALNYCENGTMTYNCYGKYNASVYPDEYKMFLMKFGSLL